jgi:uncharacterized phosphosugar-binding protein
MSQKNENHVNLYFEKASSSAQAMLESQRETFERVALSISASLQEGGLLHAFGSGHSHALVEELFHRAGGLVPVNPILESYLMPHSTPKLSGGFEKLPGLASIFMDLYDFKTGEYFLIFSNSGINAVPVEVALEAQKRSLKVVAVTSVSHSRKESSRHPSGKRLFELADEVIDTGVPHGDAGVEINAGEDYVSVAPLSGFLGIVVVNTLVTLVAKDVAKSGRKPPVFISANQAGGKEHNDRLEKMIQHRIRRL